MQDESERTVAKHAWCLPSLLALAACILPGSAAAQAENTQIWQVSEALSAAPSVPESILERVRRAPLTSAFLGRMLDPREHAFSFIGLGLSMGRRRG